MKTRLSFVSLVTLSLVFAATSHAASKSTSIVSNAEIPIILQISVSQNGQSELHFGNIMPSALDATTAGPILAQIKVQSNTGNRYQVTQTINGPLTDTANDEISVDHLKFKTSSEGSIGVPVTTPTPVTPGAQPVYSSDNAGTSDTIQAEYNLTVPAGQPAGDYAASITYTVSSI